MDYLVLVTVIVLNTALFIVSGAYGKKERFNSFLFTAFSSLMTIVFFACYNKFVFRFDLYTLKLALFNAVLSVVTMAANLQAMKYGSVALTSMVASFSLLVPTVFGILYWKEEAGVAFLLGLLLFCVSLLLMKTEKKMPPKTAKTHKNPANRQRGMIWAVAATILFFGNGFSSVLSTFHQKTGGEAYRGEYMIVAMSISCLVNFILAFIQLKKETPLYVKNASLYGTAYGLLNAGIRLGVMVLAANAVINQSVFFPVISVAVMVLVFGFSFVIFKEKFRKIQYVGVVFGIISIVLLQI